MNATIGGLDTVAALRKSLPEGRGSVTRDIPDLKKQHIALTTPLIYDTSALREFRAGSRLAFAFRIDPQVQLYRHREFVA